MHVANTNLSPWQGTGSHRRRGSGRGRSCMGPGLPVGGAGSAQTPATGWGRDGNGSTGRAGLVGEGRRGDGLGADEGIRGDTGILGSGAGPAWWQRGLWPAAWERRLSGVVGVHGGMKINKNPLQEVNSARQGCFGCSGLPHPLPAWCRGAEPSVTHLGTRINAARAAGWRGADVLGRRHLAAGARVPAHLTPSRWAAPEHWDPAGLWSNLISRNNLIWLPPEYGGLPFF